MVTRNSVKNKTLDRSLSINYSNTYHWK